MDRPPSVDKLARSLSHTGLPHPILVEVVRAAIAEQRVDEVADLVRQRQRAMLTPVINATGVLLHTNLGRAPFGVDLEGGYTNLELSLESGKRGSRQQAVGDLLASACGAEAAIVVNNCAGAVLLTLAALGAGRGVAVSRGELVEIGGGFRIPDVMAQSGAHMVEVGTTNRSRPSDYQRAHDELLANSGTGLSMILKVHQSNYKIVGFTEEASISELAELGVPVVADIGSGLLDANCPWLSGPPPPWLAGEPAARQTLDSGAELVLFSGDKLFGGPQAGIIAGRRDLVERCAKHPLARALRPGDLVLRALQEITLAYLERRGNDIAFWRLACRPLEDLQRRSEAIAQAVAGPRVVAAPCESVPGGGTLPTVTMASHGLWIDGDITAELRDRDRPIIARIDQGKTWLDVRTVEVDDDRYLIETLTSVLATGHQQ